MEPIFNTDEDEVTAKLINVLVSHSFIKASVIEELLKNRDQSLDLAKKEIQATCYKVDYDEKKLKVFDTYTEEPFYSVDLPGNPRYYHPDDFESWGTDSVILDTEELQKEGDIPLDKKWDYGIALKGGKSYLYNSGIDTQSLLGLTHQYIFGLIPKKTKRHLPYDMYFSYDYSILCLSNRDEGKVYLFDVRLKSFIDEITVRNEGSNKTINIAISMINKKIYFTDNISPYISIYDIKTKDFTKNHLNYGILGNLCLSHDELSLYLFIIKPEQIIKNISVKNFSEIKNFSVKGELFSIGDAPCDLITISPDKRFVFFMTYINDPSPYTPVISIIDSEKNKPVKRFSIKDETKPINICFRDVNPIGPVNKTLEEMIIEKRLFSINKLRDLKEAILNGEEDEFLKDQEEEKFIKVEGEELEFELRHDKVTSATHGGVFPKEKNHIFISKKANKHIREFLVTSFWMKYEIDLNEIHELHEKLDKIVEKIRLKLEYYDLEIVEVKGFYDKKLPLEGIILREYVLEMLDEEESQNRIKIKTVPINCPSCSAPLLGSWECTTCGFILEKPEDSIRKKIASADQLANVTKGNFLLLDSQNETLFEVDPFKVPVWKVSVSDIGLKSFTSVQRLENMNTLILDGASGIIDEISPKGKVHWRFKLNEKEVHLSHPSFFTIVDYDHFLIADTANHRVLETDMDGNIIWQYGKTGVPGIKENHLNKPAYIQKTYDGTYLITDEGNSRVIELTKFVNPDSAKYEMKIEWRYGNEMNIIGGGKGIGQNQLNDPTMALKDLSGNILILDTGNKRLLEVNGEKVINWEYYSESEEENLNISNPSWFVRLKNKDIVLVGDGKYVQFIPSAGNRVVWICDFKELFSRSSFRVLDEGITKIKAKYGISSRYGKRSKIDKRTHEELEQELKEIIAQKMKEAIIHPPIWEDSENPIASLAPGETVLPIPVMLIDKVNNKVMLSDREAKVYWSYGDNKVEKLVRVKMAEITPEKTVLITNAKGLIEIANEQIWGYATQSEFAEYSILSNLSENEKIWEYPCNAESAVRLKNGNTLISDSKRFRVIEINKDKDIVWEHYHITEQALPAYAQRLPEGNTLITYSSTHLVVEINPEHKIVWSFGENKISANDHKHLCFPEYACRLENGNTLITDSKNSRIIEVNPAENIVWSYSGMAMLKLISPSFAMHLDDGHTYIVHGGNREILEVDAKGKLVWKMLLPMKVKIDDDEKAHENEIKLRELKEINKLLGVKKHEIMLSLNSSSY